MELTGNVFSFPWEVSVMEWLQTACPAWLISAISFLSAFGEEIFLILILGFLYWSYDKKLGRKVGLTVLMGCCWGPMIKNILVRRRPYFDHERISIFRPVEPGADIYDISAQGYSCPSGHSANAAGLFGSLAVSIRKRWTAVLAFVMPLLVGFSRVVVGAHFPTDVLGGWLIGGLAILAVFALSRRVKSTWKMYLILLATVIPGFFFCRSADFFTSAGLFIGFMAGTLVEERMVRFENTRSPIRMVLRVLGGVAVYLALNALLKLPFSRDFLDSGTYAALMVRCVRYGIIAFVAFTFYPMCFRWTAKIGGKK